MRRSGQWITALGLGLTLQGCFGSTALERSADAVRARNSPIIARVVYHQSNFLDPENVDLYIHSGVAEADLVALWCDVLLADGLTVRNTGMWLGSLPWEPPERC